MTSKLSYAFALLAPLVFSLPIAVQAAPTVLDFEGLKDPAGNVLVDKASVDNAYANLGITIAGGELIARSRVRAGNPLPSSAFSVFATDTLTISIDPNFGGLGAAYFNELSFQYYNTLSALSLTVYARDGSTGASQPVFTPPPYPGANVTPFFWSEQAAFRVGSVDTTGQADKLIDKIVFTYSGSTGFAIDNLSLSLVGTVPPTGGGGTTVPEPGSFALLGLGLAAATMAARRRKAS